MNTAQIFIKQVSENVFNLNGVIYSLLEMDEESIIALGNKAEELRAVQKGKISTGETILANTKAKRPVMAEVSSETEYKLAEAKYKAAFQSWEKAVTTAKKNLDNARIKKGLLQNLITQIGFAWTNISSEISITNIDTQQSTKVSLLEARILTQQEDWVYTEAYKTLI